MSPEDLQRLVTLAMSYGKYKGRLIADLGSTLSSHRLSARRSRGRLLALMQELDHDGLSALLDPLRKR